MTDQSRIPYPRKDTPQTGESLIERATGTFDLNRFLPPPIPGDLIPPARKLPARSMPPQPQVQEAAPAVPQPMPASEPAVTAPETAAHVSGLVLFLHPGNGD